MVRFLIDAGSGRRNGSTTTFRRALVHNTGDILDLNFNSDYTGGVKINKLRSATSLSGGSINPEYLTGLTGNIQYQLDNPASSTRTTSLQIVSDVPDSNRDPTYNGYAQLEIQSDSTAITASGISSPMTLNIGVDYIHNVGFLQAVNNSITRPPILINGYGGKFIWAITAIGYNPPKIQHILIIQIGN